MRVFIRLLILALSIGIFPHMSFGTENAKRTKKIGMAVEFTDHAACAYVAQDKGWFRQEGLMLSSYESYVTGMALAAALTRGDIQVAYICLVPAINAFANAGVRVKVVAGTHKYGYGLVVNADKVKTVKDLEKRDIRVGCVREGGVVDVLLNRIIQKYHLNPHKILPRVRRMNPPKQVLAISMGQLDAAFLPEQWATMAEASGFRMLLTARNVWPHMQGSVLVVKEELIKRAPEAVRRLVKVSQKATSWINRHPNEAAVILARQLSFSRAKILPLKVAQYAAKIRVTPEILVKSMVRLDYETDIREQEVQEVIDYMAELGYIKRWFPARRILDLNFLK